jgi:hypothetical protein
MAKKNIMTGIGINMASISTDSAFKLGENYCVDVDKECKDLSAITDLPVYDRGSPGASKVDAEIIDKKFLLTPEWMKKNNPEESLYFKRLVDWIYTYNNVYAYGSLYAESYFPESSDQASREGWDHFGNKTTLDYVPVEDPALEITTEQEDLLIGYRNQIYNFLFECNQYNYNLEWSLVNASGGCIINPNGYFSLSETGEKSVSYSFTVQVYNPDTEETATKDFVLTTAHPSFVQEPLNMPLQLTGPSTVTIKPHRTFKAVFQATGGIPPYRFAINSPLPTQWPFQNNTRYTLHGKDKTGKLQFYPSVSSLYEEDFNKDNVGLFVLGKQIVFEKIPFKANPNETTPPPNPLVELAALPGGLSFNTPYYLIPIMNNNEWTGWIKFATSYQNAINGNAISFTGPGAGAASQTFYYYFPSTPDFTYTGTRAGANYKKTVNRYVDSVAINIAIPPLPKQWGHANRYDTHSNLEEDDPWIQTYSSHPISPNGSSHHYKRIAYTYDAETEEYTWDGDTDIYAWISDDPEDVTEPPFLDYTYSNRFLGQCIKALGFEEYSSTVLPFDPWRYESLSKTATNYFDVTVIDDENESYTMRVTVEEPDYDFSETCGVPYWKAQINYYTCKTPTPMTTEPRTEGKIITFDSDPNSETYGKTVVKDYDPDYDHDDPNQGYNALLSETVPVLDDVEKFTFEMNHYFPASRFVEYKSFTKYSLTNESTYWPYEKFTLPLNKIPFAEMSIHPIYYFDNQGYYYGDYYYNYWYSTYYNIYNFRKT